MHEAMEPSTVALIIIAVIVWLAFLIFMGFFMTHHDNGTDNHCIGYDCPFYF